MTVIKGDYQSIWSAGWWISSDDVPGNPSIVTATAGNAKITVDILADSETDTIYARYRAYVTGGWGDWSAESVGLSRTGSGKIEITSLTNGTKYQVAVYARAGACSSAWDIAVSTPTSGTNAPTSSLALALEYLKRTIAACPAFQELVDEEDSEGAKDYIFKITDKTATIPCAVIGWPGEFRLSMYASGQRNHFLKDGDMFMIVRAEIADENDDETASDIFMNYVGDIIDEMSELAGLAGYLNITALRVNHPQRAIETEQYGTKRSDGTVIGSFYQAEIAVSYQGL